MKSSNNQHEEQDLLFEEVEENAFTEYSANCSGSRSDCCTRTCESSSFATEEQWGQFLDVQGGVIQY